MTPFMRLTRHRRFVSWAVLPLVLAVVMAGAVAFVLRESTAPEPASAAARAATHGAGYTIRGQWFGTWRTGGTAGFCVEFDKGHPDSRGIKVLPGQVPGMSAAQSAQVKFVANRYGRTRSSLDAAAAAVVVWKIQNTTRFNRYYAGLVKAKAMPSRIQRRAAQIAAEAKNHGPFTLRMAMGTGYVGQRVSGTVSVRAKNGRPVAGLPVRVTVNANGRLVSQSRVSNARGVVSFAAQVTRMGAMRADARLAMPSSRTGWINLPSAGKQRLALAGRSTDNAAAYVTGQRTVGGPSVSSSCAENCRGAAPVTVRRSNPAGSATIRQYVYSNNRLIGSFDVPGGRTVARTLSVVDNAVVTTRFCYLGAGKCLSTPTVSAGALRVVCPAWISYTFTGSCPCAGAKTVTYTVSAPRNSVRTYRAVLTHGPGAGRGGAQSVTLTGGQTKSFPAVPVAKGDKVSLTFEVLGRTHLLDAMTQAS